MRATWFGCLLPFAFYLLPSTFCLLPSAFYLLPSTSCLLPGNFPAIQQKLQTNVPIFAKIVLFPKKSLLAKISMSDKAIEEYGKGYLLLLLPISFLIIFLVATWRVLLALIALALGFRIWQLYQWQKWCMGVNPIFNQLLLENQGKVTPIQLAMKCNFSGQIAQRYLDSKAEEYGAYKSDAEDGSKVYYFFTAKTLGSILDSSEPVAEIAATKATPTAIPMLKIQRN
jgi:hypothetical protein